MERKMVLNNFYRLSAPPKEEVEKHQQRVAEVIAKMGHRYVLSKPMPRIR